MAVEVACPECNSPRTIHDSYACPFCKKQEVRRGTLVEHYNCSNVGFLEEYSRNDELVCPKCDKPLRLIGTDYRKIENIFQCVSCTKKFSVPNVIHRCLSCKRTFNYETGELIHVYAYKFNDAMRQEVVANCVLEQPIVRLLKERGFSVESPGLMVGQSGQSHQFDVVASRDNRKTVIMIAADAREVGEGSVLEFFAKTFDSKPDRAFLVVIPRLSDRASMLARSYGVAVISGDDVEEVVETMRKSVLEGKENAPPED